MATWIIEETEDGFDILRNARAWRYEVDDEDEAIDAITRSYEYEGHDHIWLEDINGSRQRIEL